MTRRLPRCRCRAIIITIRKKPTRLALMPPARRPRRPQALQPLRHCSCSLPRRLSADRSACSSRSCGNARRPEDRPFPLEPDLFAQAARLRAFKRGIMHFKLYFAPHWRRALLLFTTFASTPALADHLGPSGFGAGGGATVFSPDTLDAGH